MSTPPAAWKTLDLVKEATQFLSSRDIENPRLEVELLLAAALGLRRIDLYLQFERTLQAVEVETFRGHVRERLRGRPVQYITGEAGFRLLDLEVTPDVLIPRPETELLVEQALLLVSARPQATALDLGCGSGAIAIALATESSTVSVTASDLSPAALRVARRNHRRHDIAERLHFLCGDLFAPLRTDARFDLIVSNPPYIGTDEIESLQPEVRDHEPRLALDGGTDGLCVVRRIISDARAHLSTGGSLLLEIGHTQAEEVSGLMAADGYEPSIHQDLAGICRFVIGRMI